MPKARILIVDDEQDLLWALRHTMSDAGYEVLTARNGREALALMRQHRPDLIILDIKMPGVDGFEVCRTIRRDPTLAAVPILILTGLSGTEDEVTGLRIGADDYVVKPFDLTVLKARVMALLRRSQSAQEAGLTSEIRRYLTVGELRLDLHTRQVHVGERNIPLTPAQFNLLRHLMSHPDEVFSSTRLLELVWGCDPQSASPSLVRWHIKNLRAKIEPDPTQPTYIRTVPRHGYVLVRDR